MELLGYHSFTVESYVGKRFSTLLCSEAAAAAAPAAVGDHLQDSIRCVLALLVVKPPGYTECERFVE